MSRLLLNGDLQKKEWFLPSSVSAPLVCLKILSVLWIKRHSRQSPQDNRVMRPCDITAIQANNSSSPFCYDIRPPKTLYHCTIKDISKPPQVLTSSYGVILVISSLSLERNWKWNMSFGKWQSRFKSILSTIIMFCMRANNCLRVKKM